MKLGKLDVEVVSGPPARLVMAGRIDDTAKLGELAAQLPAGEVAIDTSGVTFISSIGLREWMRLVRALRERGQPVTLERVADVLMTQMNMISELAAPVRVVSFHAPYVCPSCGAEATPVIDAIHHAHLLRQMQAPAMPCGECGAAMELADFPERYMSIFRA